MTNEVVINRPKNELQLVQLGREALMPILESFSALPHTNHADGQYRLRRYSVIYFLDGEVKPSDKHDFVQTSDINHFQGDIVRRFEPIEADMLASTTLKTMCSYFTQSNHLPNGQEIEIHQMRVVALMDETPVAPEGVHQDGFDHIAIIGIARHNVVGGEIMLYNHDHEAPFFRKVLDDGEMAMLDDHRLWHNAQPIRVIDPKQDGYMDVMVLTAKEGRNATN